MVIERKCSSDCCIVLPIPFHLYVKWLSVIKRVDCLLSITLQQDESEIGLLGGNGQLLTLGLGLIATALAATYVTRLAKVIILSHRTTHA